jgi:hypothetical protein
VFAGGDGGKFDYLCAQGVPRTGFHPKAANRRNVVIPTQGRLMKRSNANLRKVDESSKLSNANPRKVEETSKLRHFQPSGG